MSNQYSEFFLGSNSKVARIETLEIAHPAMSQTYWIVRNIKAGFTANLETTASQTFSYYPVRITRRNQSEDLDQGYSITFGDIGKTLSKELDAIQIAGGFDVKPVVKYRAWRSDYLTAPLYGPIIVEIKQVTTGREGCTFEALAPGLNGSKTGELYRLDRFPMLRGVL